MLEKIRSERSILGGSSNNNLAEKKTTIYLGLFNAGPYIASLENQLLSQEIELPILVADNHSSDDTWQLISHWIEVFEGRVTLIRNPINLGGAGSLLLNSDHIQTPWFITMHQDDFYKPNHARILSEGIDKTDATAICITTEMQSMDNEGRRLPTPPRASWFLPDFEPATIFHANLKNHTIPFPAAAFRKDAFFSVRTPWHSTAFPDTEWVLRAASVGNFQSIPVETMVYRENPLSESHRLDLKASQNGAFAALIRVFASETFIDLCDSILPDDRSNFAAGIFEGLGIRLSNPELCEMVRLIAAEQMAVSWNYGEPSSLAKIRDQYLSGGESRAVELLDALGGRMKLDERPAKPSATYEVNKPLTQNQSSYSKGLAWLYGSLPRVMRKFLVHTFRSTIASGKPAWDFRWRK